MIVNGKLTFANLTGAPGSPEEGQIYYNSTDHRFYIYDGTDWRGL